jgi:flagellar assembly protein FliH
MSNKTREKFQRNFLKDDKVLSYETNEPWKYDLKEFINPDEIGEKRFIFDTDTARNFDQTNVKHAREGVKEILSDTIDKAKAKATQIREESQKLGYDEGYKEGFQKGENESSLEFEPFFKTFDQCVRDLTIFRKKMYGKVEREMMEMVVGLTKKIVHHEMSIREDSIKDMIRLAVDSVLDKETMIIKVNPADKGYAESFRPELYLLFDEIGNITFEASPKIERGGCVIETNFGTVDAQIKHLDDVIDKILNLTPRPFEEATDMDDELEEAEPDGN